MTIHDVDRVGLVLDRRFGGAGRTFASLARILAWAVIGLVAVGALWPAPLVDLTDNTYNRVLDNPWVRVVTLDPNDPRGFGVTDDGDAFTIAWIDGSSIQSISDERYTFVPADVRDLIPEIDGRPVAIDMYFLSGARVMDLYVGTRQALVEDADMVVVVLNPIWVFNDAAVQGWDNLDSLAVGHLIGNAADWPLLVAFTSPQDKALSVGANWLPAIRDRWSYAAILKDKLNRFDLLEPSEGEATPKNPDELSVISNMTIPLEFWSRYRPIVDPAESVPVRQLALLQRSRVDGSTINDLVIDRLLDSLAASEVPSYVYVPPIAPEVISGEQTESALALIEHHLAQVGSSHESPNLVVNPETLARSLGPMKFNDLVHIAEVGPLAVYLANTLCEQLVESAIVEKCEPRPQPQP